MAKVARAPDPSPVTPEEITAIQQSAEDGLFDDFEEPVEVLRLDGIPAIDSDLEPDEKKEFIALLNRFMPLEQRALQLCKLARLIDTKRAPVGLRAIQEINAITGLKSDKPTENAPMFQLPPDTTVQVTVTKAVQPDKVAADQPERKKD